MRENCIIIGIGKKTAFSQIRSNDISMECQRAHLFTECRCVHIKNLSHISHDGVHKKQGILFAEYFVEMQDLLNLSFTSEKTGINSVQCEAPFLPFFCEKINFVRKVIIIIAFVSGLIRQNSGGYRACLYAHHRDDRNRRGQRTFTKTGQILDDCHFFNHISNIPF